MSLRLLIKDDPRRSLAIATDTHALVLRHTLPSVNAEQHNSSEGHATSKSRCMVEFSDGVDLSAYRVLRSSKFSGTLGLINIGEDLFLCLICDAVRVATVRPGEHVYRILSVEFFCLNRSHYDSEPFPDTRDEDFVFGNGHQSFNYADETTVEHPCLELKRMLSSGTFHYSNDFDLTNRLQDRLSEQSAFDIDGLDDEFLWSQYLIKPLLEFRSRLTQPVKQTLDATRILTLAIRGFVSTITIPPSSVQRRTRTNLPSSLTLISRLSCRRAGTRFNSRGIDDDGNVANFVETESILWHPPTFCFSYVQTRGSVPLFWEQATGLLPGQQKIQITRSPEATQPSFDRHFERLEMAYGVISILNLLSESRSGEAELTARYKHHVRHSPLNQDLEMGVSSGNRLLDTQLDFHAEAKAGASAATSAVKRLARGIAVSFGYFASEAVLNGSISDTTGAIPATIAQQAGVFRTNCLDCLDRTNLVQTILSQIALESFFQHHGEAPLPDFWTRHSTLWADNGDALSKIYAGTGALKSSFTRHGKMSLAGALADARKSATRIYVNNFVDKGRQNTIDMLLGRLMEQSPVYLYDPITDFVNAELRRRATEYTSSESVHIWCGTFNLNGRSTGMDQDLSTWLHPPTIQIPIAPDIMVVGFQEIVELSPQQIMSTDPERLRGWEKSVSSALNAKIPDEYVLLRSGQLVGAALLVFVKRKVLHRIKNVEGAERKLGMSGVAGNKGAVAIRLEYGNTRLCFLTAHLAAGFANIEQRNRDYNIISRGLRFQHNRSIEDHDGIIWAGDFNYRIGLGDDKVRQLIKAGDLDQLYHNDQLSLQMMAGKIFPYYSEARITFLPTYKYENGTDEYDRSEKARIPAWCDRILRKGDVLKQLSYSTAPLFFSDHRPVLATFRCTINMIDEEIKQRLNQESYQRRREDIGDTIVDGEHDEPDEDLIGYDAVAPGLPPASSDRRKWWLDDQLPARSNIETPHKHAILNNRRPQNPFSPTGEPVWQDEFASPQVSSQTSSSQGDHIDAVQDTRPQQSPITSSQKVTGRLSQGSAIYRPDSRQSTDESRARRESLSNSMPSSSSKKPAIPKKPHTLTIAAGSRSAGVPLSQHTNVSPKASPGLDTSWHNDVYNAQQRGTHNRLETTASADSNPQLIRQRSSPEKLTYVPNLVDDDHGFTDEAKDMPVLLPARRNGT